jgi:hypothetical protein
MSWCFPLYRRLCHQLNVATETVPKSKGEVVLLRLQDAANASAAAGRSFLSLCSLVDLHLTGRMAREELIHTTKMMDCPLTMYDVEALLELLPNNAVGADDKIDYRILQSVLQTYVPAQTKAYDLDPRYSGSNYNNNVGGTPHGGQHAFGQTGALPAYATPRGSVGTTHMSYNGYPPGMGPGGPQSSSSYRGREISTPLGYKVHAPMGFNEDPFGATLRMSGMGGMGGAMPAGLELNSSYTSNAPGASSGAYERILRLIVERVKIGIEEKVRSWGAAYSLRQQFEQFDVEGSGVVPVRTFQAVLGDIGVLLSPSDLQTAYGLFGRPDDGGIHYEPFMRAVEANTSTIYPPALQASQQQPGPLSLHLPQRPPPPPVSLSLNSSRSFAAAPYVNPRVLSRLREIRAEGIDPREYFAAHDVDRSGMVRIYSFC